MCGIIGFSGKSDFNINNLKLLFTYNTLERGKDALGYYSPLNGVFKKAEKPVDLIGKIDLKPDTVFLGHVRAKTVGVNSDKNAHPFEINNLVGIMNGTILNYKDLCIKYGVKESDYNVDSEAIFAIAEKEKNLKVLSEVSGGCAVIVADKEHPEVIYVYRNSERPLFCGYINGDMYISSEEASLKIIGCAETRYFFENTLYTIKNGEILKRDIFTPKVYKHDKLIDISGKSPAPFVNDMKNWMFKGRWLRFDSPTNTEFKDIITNGLTFDKFYYCIGFSSSKDTNIIVLDNNNKPVTISFHCFSYTPVFTRVGEEMLMLSDIETGKGKSKKKVISKGDIVYLDEYKSEKNTIHVKVNKDDDFYWIISSKCVRHMTYTEKNNHKSTTTTYTPNLQPQNKNEDWEDRSEIVTNFTPTTNTNNEDDGIEYISVTKDSLKELLDVVEFQLSCLHIHCKRHDPFGEIQECIETISDAVDEFDEINNLKEGINK